MRALSSVYPDEEEEGGGNLSLQDVDNLFPDEEE